MEKVEACVPERLTPQTPDLEVYGYGFNPLPSRCFLIQGTLNHFVSLQPGV